MEEIILYVVIGVVAVLVSAAYVWFKKKGYVDFIKKFYLKYQGIIDAYGDFIKKEDPQLYKELVEFGETFKNAVADDEITREEFIAIYKEAKDIYDRCREIIRKT